MKPGCFKIGNTGGMLDNILASKLFRPGRYEVVGNEFLETIFVRNTFFVNVL